VAASAINDAGVSQAGPAWNCFADIRWRDAERQMGVVARFGSPYFPPGRRKRASPGHGGAAQAGCGLLGKGAGAASVMPSSCEHDGGFFYVEEIKGGLSRGHNWEEDPTGQGHLQRLRARYGPAIQERLEFFKQQVLEPALSAAVRRVPRKSGSSRISDGIGPSRHPSAFSRARHERFRDSDALRRVFERVVEACIAAGLVGGEGFAVDASLIVADANKQRSVPGSEWNKTRDPHGASRAMREYLATLEDAAFGAASEVTPKFVSPSDPAAQWTGAMRGPAFFAYANNYLIDVKFVIIMDVKATRAIRQAEVGAAKTMIDRTQERFGIKPAYLAADTAYGSADTLDWVVNEKIEPHLPVIDKSKREDGTFSREDFRFDEERNIYICPADKILTTTGHIGSDHGIRYFASVPACRVCTLKSKCCPNMAARRIVRDVNEVARDVARALAKTEAFERSRRNRKRVEMLFAHLKRILRLGRFRLRGP
jgi:hypothetical protein